MAGKRRRSRSTQATLVDPGTIVRTTGPRAVQRGAVTVGGGGGRAAAASSIVSVPTSRLPLVAQGELGSGGQGKVLQAFDPNLGRVVAMKVLAPQLMKAPASLRRFVDEARVMAQLDHPNIIPIHDLVVDQGRTAHFVMKLVRGRTLESLARQRLAPLVEPNGQPKVPPARHKVKAPSVDKSAPAAPVMTLRDLLMTFLKVCDALAFAHDRDIIHCDLKPDNIMVGEFGETYLMDWGIASQLAAGQAGGRAPGGKSSVRGTPDFMSPEQAKGDPAGPTKRTDVFGLGAVLYFILTGRPPFPGKTSAQALARAKKGLYDDPETVSGPKVPAALVRIVRKAMDADPAARFDSVCELREQVDRVLRGDWHLPVKSFAPGTVVVREGDWADAAYIIVSGSCVVSRTVGGQRQVIRTLGPGAVFGETAVLSGDVRTASVETVDEVLVRVVTRQLFHDQLGMDSWLAKFVLALADRFTELEQRTSAAHSRAAEPRGSIPR